MLVILATGLCLCICVSVCLTHAGIVSKRLHLNELIFAIRASLTVF